MNKEWYSAYGVCRSPRPAPLREAETEASSRGLLPAYLDPRAYSYLLTESPNGPPLRAPYKFSLLEHPEHGAPTDENHKLYFLSSYQVYRLEHSAPRFGQANSEAPLSEHLPSYAPNGLRMFTGSGTLRVAAAVVPLNSQIDPRLFFIDGAVYLICPAASPSDPLGQRPLGCLSAGFVGNGAPNFPNAEEPLPAADCAEDYAGYANFTQGTTPGVPYAGGYPAGICGPPDGVPYWNTEGEAWAKQSATGQAGAVRIASTLTASQFFLAGALTPPSSYQIQGPVTALPVVRTVPITPQEMFLSYESAPGPDGSFVGQKFPKKPASGGQAGALCYTTDWQSPSDYSIQSAGAYVDPKRLPCSPEDSFIRSRGAFHHPCLLGDDFFRSGAAMWTVRHGPPGTKTIQLENLYTGAFLSAGTPPEVYQSWCCTSGATGTACAYAVDLGVFLRAQPQGTTNGSWGADYDNTLWTVFVPGADILGPSGVTGLLGAAPYTAMMAERSIILQNYATGVLLSLGGSDMANLFFATSSSIPDAPTPAPWQPAKTVALLENMFVFHAVPKERLPSGTVTYAGTRLNVTEENAYLELLDAGTTVMETLGENTLKAQLQAYLYPSSENITRTASVPTAMPADMKWASPTLEQRYSMLQQAISTRGGAAAFIPPMPYVATTFTQPLGPAPQAAFDAFTAKQRLAGLPAVVGALTVLVPRDSLASTVETTMTKFGDRAQLMLPALFHLDGFHREVFNLFSLADSYEVGDFGLYLARRKPVFPRSGNRLVPVLPEMTLLPTGFAPEEATRFGGNSWVLARTVEDAITSKTTRLMVLAELTSPTEAKTVAALQTPQPPSDSVLEDWYKGVSTTSVSGVGTVAAVEVGEDAPYSCMGASDPEGAFWGPFYPDQPCKTVFRWTSPVLSNTFTVIPCPSCALDLYAFAAEQEPVQLDVVATLSLRKGISNLLVFTKSAQSFQPDTLALGVMDGQVKMVHLDSPAALEMLWEAQPSQGSAQGVTYVARALYMGGLVLGVVQPYQGNPPVALLQESSLEQGVTFTVAPTGTATVTATIGGQTYTLGFPHPADDATEGTPVLFMAGGGPGTGFPKWTGPFPPEVISTQAFSFSYPGSPLFNVEAPSSPATDGTVTVNSQALPVGGESVPVWRMLEVAGDSDGRSVLAVSNANMGKYTYLQAATLSAGADVTFVDDPAQATPILLLPIAKWDGKIPESVDYSSAGGLPLAAPYWRPQITTDGLPPGVWFQLLVKVGEGTGTPVVPGHPGQWLALSVGSDPQQVVRLASAGAQGGLTKQTLCHIYGGGWGRSAGCGAAAAGSGLLENLSLPWARVDYDTASQSLLAPLVLAELQGAAHSEPAWTSSGSTSSWSLLSQVFSFSSSTAWTGASVEASSYLPTPSPPVPDVLRSRVLVPLFDPLVARKPQFDSAIERGEDAAIVDASQSPPLPQTRPTPRLPIGFPFDTLTVEVTARKGICGIAGLVCKPLGTCPPAFAPLRRSQALPSPKLAVWTSPATIYRAGSVDPLTAEKNVNSGVQLLLNDAYTSVDKVHKSIQTLGTKGYEGFSFSSRETTTTTPVPTGLPTIFQFSELSNADYGRIV